MRGSRAARKRAIRWLAGILRSHRCIVSFVSDTAEQSFEWYEYYFLNTLIKKCTFEEMWWLQEVCLDYSHVFLLGGGHSVCWTSLVEFRICNIKFRPFKGIKLSENVTLREVVVTMHRKLNNLFRSCRSTLICLVIATICYDGIIWNVHPLPYRVECFVSRVEIPIHLMYWSFPRVRSLTLLTFCSDLFAQYVPDFFAQNKSPLLECIYVDFRCKDLSFVHVHRYLEMFATLPVERIHLKIKNMLVGADSLWRLIGAPPSKDQEVCRSLGNLNLTFPNVKSLDLELNGQWIPHGHTVRLVDVKRLRIHSELQQMYQLWYGEVERAERPSFLEMCRNGREERRVGELGGKGQYVNGCIRRVKVSTQSQWCGISLTDARAASSIESLQVDDYPGPEWCGGHCTLKALFFQLAEFLTSPHCSIKVLSLKPCYKCIDAGVVEAILRSLSLNATVRDLTLDFHVGHVELLRDALVSITSNITKLSLRLLDNDLATLEPLATAIVQHPCTQLVHIGLTPKSAPDPYTLSYDINQSRYMRDMVRLILHAQRNASRTNRLVDIARGGSETVSVADAYEIARVPQSVITQLADSVTSKTLLFLRDSLFLRPVQAVQTEAQWPTLLSETKLPVDCWAKICSYLNVHDLPVV